MAAMGTMALLGFGFSLLAARLFTPGQVGAGMSLVSATSLIAYLSLFGLNVTIVRFYANSQDRNAQVTRSLVIVGGFGLLFSAVYVVFVPIYAPELSFVRDNPLYALGFLIAGTASGLNLLTDFIFIAARKSEYNLLIDGFVQGITKLLLPAALIGLGAYGIFASVGGGYLVALVVSVVCMCRILGFRFDFRRTNAVNRYHLSYSISGYLSSVATIGPIMALPLITLHARGEAEAGYFFLTFQIANTVYSVAYAIGEAFFAEGSFDESRLVSLLKRSALLLIALLVPAVVVLIAGSRWMLSLFGPSYAENGDSLLKILAIGAFAVALNTWTASALKLLGLMKSLVISSAVFAVTTIGLAQLWGTRGLDWLGWAWLIGNLVTGLFAVAAIVIHRRNSAGRIQAPLMAGASR